MALLRLFLLKKVLFLVKKFKNQICCQGRNVIDSKRRAEFDPIADITNAGIITDGYGSAGISAGGAV